MAKLTSSHLTDLEQQISELKQKLFAIEEKREQELQKLYCEAEGLMQNKTVIRDIKGKEYLFYCAERGIDTTNNGKFTRTVFAYLRLKSGKFSDKLTEVYYQWEKV